MTPSRTDGAWPVSWDATRDALLDSALAATPAQRLAWLEAALQLAYATGALSADADVPRDWRATGTNKA